MAKPLLILGAFEPEVSPLRELVSHADITIETSGIGSTMAAARTARLLAGLSDVQGLGVLFIGSVGSVDVDVPLLSLVGATAVSFIDVGIVSGISDLPQDVNCEFDADDVLQCWEKADLHYHERIYSTPSLTRDTEVAVQLSARSQSRFENLELCGVAAACAEFGVPWGAVSAVTNYVGPDGGREWEGNHLSAAERTAEFIHNQISPSS